MYLLVTAAVLLAPSTATSQRIGEKPNDHLLVLDHRAGPYRYLASFQQGAPDAYSAALAALGHPTRFRVDGNLCRVTWAQAGITVGFASGLRPCAAGSLFHAAWYGMSLFGPEWHNQLGLKVGDPIAKVRRLYPKARFESSSGRPWLVLLVKREQEFRFIHLAVAVNRLGRVTSIEVPATYIY